MDGQPKHTNFHGALGNSYFFQRNRLGHWFATSITTCAWQPNASPNCQHTHAKSINTESINTTPKNRENVATNGVERFTIDPNTTVAIVHSIQHQSLISRDTIHHTTKNPFYQRVWNQPQSIQIQPTQTTSTNQKHVILAKILILINAGHLTCDNQQNGPRCHCDHSSIYTWITKRCAMQSTIFRSADRNSYFFILVQST